MIKIAICDDEIAVLDLLKSKIREYFETQNLEYNITFFLSGELLLESKDYFDVIFLDIKMNGISGMVTANQLRIKENHSNIVFVTSLKEYVFDAFQVDAVNYLLKPVDDQKLSATLNKIVRSITASHEEFLLLQSGHSVKKLKFSDIYYAEVYNHKVFIYTKQGSEHFHKKIDLLESELNDNFIRCHRSYILHLKYVQSYRNGIVTLTNDVQVPIAKRRQSDFYTALLRYQRKEVR